MKILSERMKVSFRLEMRDILRVKGGVKDNGGSVHCGINTNVG